MSKTISTIAGAGDSGFQFVGDQGPATAALLLFGFTGTNFAGIAVDASGDLYIADTKNYRVRKVSAATRVVTTVAGTGKFGSTRDGVPATTTEVVAPEGIAVDRNGNLYISNDSVIYRVDRSGIIRRVAGAGSGTGDGIPATSARLQAVFDIALDSPGNIYFSEWEPSRIRKVDVASGTIRTVAGLGPRSYGGDGGPATAAGLNLPSGLAVDPLGNVFVADEFNSRIRRVDAATGVITTVAGTGEGGFQGDGGPATRASVWLPRDVAFAPNGDLLISEFGNLRLRRVSKTTGRITTYAGAGGGFTRGTYSGDAGPATFATISYPDSLAVDADGNVFISDTASHRVRVIYECITMIPPQLQSPSSGSSGISLFPKLAWKAVKGAFRYDVLLDTVNPPKAIVAADIATTSYSPANLEALATYYWQVIAKGDPYCTPPSSAASEIRSFTTAATCVPP